MSFWRHHDGFYCATPPPGSPMQRIFHLYSPPSSPPPQQHNCQVPRFCVSLCGRASCLANAPISIYYSSFETALNPCTHNSLR